MSNNSNLRSVGTKFTGKTLGTSDVVENKEERAALTDCIDHIVGGLADVTTISEIVDAVPFIAYSDPAVMRQIIRRGLGSIVRASLNKANWTSVDIKAGIWKRMEDCNRKQAKARSTYQVTCGSNMEEIGKSAATLAEVK